MSINKKQKQDEAGRYQKQANITFFNVHALISTGYIESSVTVQTHKLAPYVSLKTLDLHTSIMYICICLLYSFWELKILHCVIKPTTTDFIPASRWYGELQSPSSEPLSTFICLVAATPEHNTTQTEEVSHFGILAGASGAFWNPLFILQLIAMLPVWWPRSTSTVIFLHCKKTKRLI